VPGTETSQSRERGPLDDDAERQHIAIGNLPSVLPQRAELAERLGGLLRQYERKAAWDLKDGRLSAANSRWFPFRRNFAPPPPWAVLFLARQPRHRGNGQPVSRSS